MTIAVVLLPALLSSCGRLSGSRDHVYLSAGARLAAIRKAQVWMPTDVASMDLRSGPAGRDAFAPGDTVSCRYVERIRNGDSPKFTCVLPSGDEVKVKYGRDNGEVYAEVAATRLLWALGFGADRMYPVRVVCRGCPSTQPAGAPAPITATVTFEPAAVERELPGETLETYEGSGWSWPELDEVDEASGGAPRAERDALKLLAVVLQHTDSKPQQQRLLCIGGGRVDHGVPCRHPFMMINDLGLTFGGANLFNRRFVGSVNFEQWSQAPVWLGAAGCIGNLPASETGTLSHPVISEAGRAFLAGLLVRLSNAQLRDLFAVARFPERTGPSVRSASVDEWVEAFDHKRDEVVNRRCPQG
jgi:hypothetical protein